MAKAMIVPLPEEKGVMNAMMSQLGGLAVLAGAATGVTSTADLYVTMLKSETIKDPIISQFNLMETTGKKYRADVYAILDKNVSITAGKKDGVISIVVEDKDPKRAADMANAFTDELQKLTVKLSTSGAGKNRSFFEERLARTKSDLAKAEAELKSFQAKNKAINMTEQAKATIEGIARLKAELAVQEIKYSSLARTLTDSTQEIRNLKATIENIKSQIANLEGTADSRSAIPSVGSMPVLGEEYLRLMREVKIQENIFETLTKQAELAKLSEAKDVAPLQVLQVAKVPGKKIKPKRGLIVLVTTFTVFVFSVFAAFVLESLAKMPIEEKMRWETMKRNLYFFNKG